MRAAHPHTVGHATNPTDAVRIFYEVFGPADAERTILFLPSWAIVHGRIWKAQVPYFSRSGFRAVTFDNRGSGQSDRPATGYTVERIAEDALAVLDAAGIERAALVGLSAAARWGLKLAADHPERVTHLALIGPSVMLGPPLERLRRFFEERERYEGWDKYSAAYWRRDYPDFVEFFARQVYPEPHSTKQIEDFVAWALETDGEVLIKTIQEGAFPEATELVAHVRCPTLIIHGEQDSVAPLELGQTLHRAIRGSELIVLEGAGHAPNTRDPVRVNQLLHEFLGRVQPPERRWRRAPARVQKRALFVSSPIGLGHAEPDLAIADALRRLVPSVEIDWLAQDPVTRVLAARGERIHPLSASLAGESRHIESECGEHDLHIFRAWRRMDEILLANFLVFYDAVRDADYDLWVADEGWDIDYYLHENPELKTASFVWLTDFVGWLPVRPDDEWLTADYNAEMLKQIARFPRVRDRALFVGHPTDIVPETFGPRLPGIREWTEAHYRFPGYVLNFDPHQYADRAALRERLGYGPDERVIVASVGGTAVGYGLLRRITQSFPELRHRVPGLRLIAVAGPRIDPAALPQVEGVDYLGYVPNLSEQLAACDLALVQGGLSTAMELVATGRPFLYFPLRNHFEQNLHVPYRLTNYGVGSDARVDFTEATPERLAERIDQALRSVPEYRPVETGGAERAAQMIAELL